MGQHLHVEQVGVEDVNARGVGRPEDESPGVGAHEEEDEQSSDELSGCQVTQEVEHQENNRYSQKYAIYNQIIRASVFDFYVNVDKSGQTGQEKKNAENPAENFGAGKSLGGRGFGAFGPNQSVVLGHPVAGCQDTIGVGHG